MDEPDQRIALSAQFAPLGGNDDGMLTELVILMCAGASNQWIEAVNDLQQSV